MQVDYGDGHAHYEFRQSPIDPTLEQTAAPRHGHMSSTNNHHHHHHQQHLLQPDNASLAGFYSDMARSSHTPPPTS